MATRRVEGCVQSRYVSKGFIRMTLKEHKGQTFVLYGDHPGFGDARGLAAAGAGVCLDVGAGGAVRDFCFDSEAAAPLRRAVRALDVPLAPPPAARREAFRSLLRCLDLPPEEAAALLAANPFEALRVRCGALYGLRAAGTAARRAGCAMSDSARCLETARYLLPEALREGGHVCMPAAEYRRLLVAQFPPDEVDDALARLLSEADAVLCRGGMYYTPSLLAAEDACRAYLAVPEPPEPPEPPELPEGGAGAAELSEEQADAVRLALRRRRCAVVTGGAGVGKTTVVASVARALRGSLALVAPTAKAARRLQEVCGGGAEAGTLHRFLGIAPGREDAPEPGGAAAPPAARCAPGTTVVVDEAGMLDVRVAARLFRAAERGRLRLLFVGDPHQLGSVMEGRVLQDLIAWAERGRALARLTRVFRHTEGGAPGSIAGLARALLEGRVPERADLCVPDGEVRLVEAAGTERATAEIARAYEGMLAEAGGDPDRVIHDSQILTARKTGPLGAEDINAAVCHLTGDVDKVMCVVNSGPSVPEEYAGEARPACNGDIGQKIDHRRLRAVDSDAYSDTGALVPAHAITVHKSQGSEYEGVILAVHPAHGRMLTRQLLYTAVTRARRRLVVVGSYGALVQAACTEQPERRSGGFL